LEIQDVWDTLARPRMYLTMHLHWKPLRAQVAERGPLFVEECQEHEKQQYDVTIR